MEQHFDSISLKLQRRKVYLSLINLKNFKEPLIPKAIRLWLVFIISKLWTSLQHFILSLSNTHEKQIRKGISVSFSPCVNSKKKIPWFVAKNFDSIFYPLRNTILGITGFCGSLPTPFSTLSFPFLLISLNFLFRFSIVPLILAVASFFIHFFIQYFLP